MARKRRSMRKDKSNTFVTLALLGVIVFIITVSVVPFRDSLSNLLYPKPPSLAAGTFSLVATNSYAATQSSAEGKIISTLEPWNNKLYMGYGDWASNTGPIQVSYFDPATGIISGVLSFATEAVTNYRPIGASLYAPTIDSRGSSALVYAKGEPWIQQTGSGFSAIHVFDIATFDGSDLFAAGASGNNAVVWKSTDGGLAWTTSLTVQPVSGISGDYARFFFITKYNGKLYVQARDNSGKTHPKSKVYDGTSWSDGPNMFTTYNGLGWNPQIFAGKLVYRTWIPNAWFYLMTFDGTKDTLINNYGLHDYTIDGSYLYALEANGTVRRTTDLLNWQTIAVGPSLAQSIGILNNYLYIGTKDSKLYKYSEPLNQISTTPTSAFTPTPTRTPTPVPPTPTNTPPVIQSLSISNVRASNITTSSVAITWTTSLPAASQVTYGLSSASLATSSPLDLVLKTSHLVTLTGLSKNTRYYYQARSQDSSGNTVSSSVFNFRTKNK